jgi:hypothetical protein
MPSSPKAQGAPPYAESDAKELRLLTTNDIKERIARGEISTTLQEQQYLKHIHGTVQYTNYARTQQAKGLAAPSRLHLTYAQSQDFILRYAGTGTQRIARRTNRYTNEEFVTSPDVIGEVEYDGRFYLTTRVLIKYSESGSHIIAVIEEWMMRGYKSE